MPEEGIDVSNNNKGRFPASGVDFMFAKTSQGTGFDDRFFEGYVKDARSRGIPWAPYHFAEPDANTPEAEAAWFLRNAQRGPLGWALDVESRDVFNEHHVKLGTINPLAVVGAARLAVWCDQFYELVAPTLGQGWMYCNRDYATSLYPRLQQDWRTWLAVLDGHPHVATFKGRNVDIEQFAIVDDFDRDLARTDLGTLQAMGLTSGEDDMIPPAIVQLVDTNGDLVVMPAGGGRPWTAKPSDAGFVAVFVFRAFDQDPTRRYPFPNPIPIVSDPGQVAAIRTWLAT